MTSPHPAASAAWAGRTAWTVLDLGIAQPNQFLNTWQAWRSDAQRPTMLHYVGVLTEQDAAQWPPNSYGAFGGAKAESTTPSAAPSDNAGLISQLQAASWELGTGFHRLLLDGGYVSLTLCVGEPKAMLDAQHFIADEVHAPYPPQGWDLWFAKALAQCCKRLAHLHITLPRGTAVDVAALGDVFTQAGFAVEDLVQQTAANLAPQTLHAVFDPRWSLRSPLAHATRQPGRCVVVGAGLSGASVARAMALRGWQVRVLEAANAPAAGASGLPAGLLAPLTTADDSPRAQMSRSGTRLMLQHAQQLLKEGRDWKPTGVQQLGEHPQWHAHAGWVKPSALVQAWLAHPSIELSVQSAAQSMVKTSSGWVVRGADGTLLAEADVVIVANAMASKALLSSELSEQLDLLHAMHGTVSLGPHASHSESAQPRVTEPLPPHPVNGHGSLIGHVPSAQGFQWFAGATYDIAPSKDVSAAHQSNLKRLRELLPQAADALAPLFAAGQVQHWSGTRCVTHDRLPLVGPVSSEVNDSEAGLWVSVGMGSRGLSFAALCAELLVARLHAEPLPLPARQARGLDAQRPRRKRVPPTGVDQTF